MAKISVIEAAKNKKASILYHGSPLDIEELKANPSSLSKKGNPVVFASPDRWAAIAFTGKWDDSVLNQGTVNGVPHLQEMQKDAFKKVYGNGGYLYTIEDDSFYHHGKLTRFERISDKDNIRPIKKEFIKDPIKELEKLGVKLIPYTKGK